MRLTLLLLSIPRRLIGKTAAFGAANNRSTRFAGALLASFVIQWQVQPGVQYVVERKVSNTWAAIDTFSGPVDTIDALQGVNYYTGRAMSGIERSHVISTLYLDFAPDDVSTVDIKSANVIQGDTLCYVKTRMQSRFWTCAYTIKGGHIEAVECECEFDYNRSGKVELSDLVRFGAGYFAGVYNLSDFASFGEVYQRASKVNWRA
jgi:hypothetical protein